MKRSRTPLAAAVVFAVSVGGAVLASNSTDKVVSLLPPLSDTMTWHTVTLNKFNVELRQLASSEPDTFAARIVQVDGHPEHGVITSKPITLVDGQVYTLSFQGKADALHPVRVVARTVDGNQRSVGLDDTFTLGFGYDTFTKTFVAHGANHHWISVDFAVASQAGRVTLKDLSLTTTGKRSNEPAPIQD